VTDISFSGTVSSAKIFVETNKNNRQLMVNNRGLE
jgi:hypothetical protein